jgi:hypothetical protein
MARPVGHGRTIEQKQPVPKYKLPPDLAPDEEIFFRPPTGVDVVTPLSELPKSASPEIRNLVLDRGVMRSRNAVEKYHNKITAEAIQLTADIKGLGIAGTTITARSTGWTDPDGINDGQNTLTRGPGIDSVPEANRLFSILGDPAPGNNVDAYDDKYIVAFSVTADHGTVPGSFTVGADVHIEYSTDGGVNYTVLGTWSAATTSGIVTNNYSITVTVSGTPTQVKFRLKLTVVVQAPSGLGTGTVAISDLVRWNTAATVASPSRIPMRWTEGHIQTYDDPTDVAADWTSDYSYPASQLNSDNLLPSYVVWADQIISTDIGDTPQAGSGVPIGSKGLVTTALAAGHATSILTHSPRAAQLFVFGNRVIAVRTNEWTATSDPWVTGAVTNLGRIRWSAKNNSNDWDGIGSGFEDLKVSAGSADEAMAGVAVSDETAIVVTEKTIRRMDVTGFVDAPFSFGFLDKSLGTLSRYTIRGVPGGCIFIGYDDAFIVTLSGVERIGSKALRASLASISNPRTAYGYLDEYNSRYLVALKEGSQQVVWQYSLFDKGWTRLIFPFDVAAIDLSYFDIGGVRFYGSYLTQAVREGLSTRENPTRTQDVDLTGADVDAPIEARTGLIVPAGPLFKTQLIQLELVYESAGLQDIIFEYSSDGGNTWSLYGMVSVIATTRPSSKKVVQTLTAEALQIRARSATLGKLKIISLHAHVLPGPRIVT